MTAVRDLGIRLREVVGEAGVVTDPADLGGYLTDWRHAYGGSAAAGSRASSMARRTGRRPSEHLRSLDTPGHGVSGDQKCAFAADRGRGQRLWRARYRAARRAEASRRRRPASTSRVPASRSRAACAVPAG